jgi:hypothetical protein
MKVESSSERPIPNSAIKSYDGRGKATPKTKTPITPEKSNGAEITENDTEPNGKPGTTALSTRAEKNSLPVERSTGRSTDLKEHLTTLREASSDSMNLMDSSISHLHGLMISVADEQIEKNPERHWAKDNVLVVTQTVNIARELHKSMRLKLDTVRALHKISLDIG